MIPLPELVVVLAAGLVVLTVRMLRASRGRRSSADTGRQRDDGRRETERQRIRLIAGCVLIILVSLPLIFKLVPPNGTYGFRIRETRSNPVIWYAANQFMGWALSIAAVISGTALFTLPATIRRPVVWAVFLAPVLTAFVACFLYVDQLAH